MDCEFMEDEVPASVGTSTSDMSNSNNNPCGSCLLSSQQEVVGTSEDGVAVIHHVESQSLSLPHSPQQMPSPSDQSASSSGFCSVDEEILVVNNHNFKGIKDQKLDNCDPSSSKCHESSSCNESKSIVMMTYDQSHCHHQSGQSDESISSADDCHTCYNAMDVHYKRHTDVDIKGSMTIAAATPILAQQSHVSALQDAQLKLPADIFCCGDLTHHNMTPCNNALQDRTQRTMLSPIDNCRWRQSQQSHDTGSNPASAVCIMGSAVLHAHDPIQNEDIIERCSVPTDDLEHSCTDNTVASNNFVVTGPSVMMPTSDNFESLFDNSAIVPVASGAGHGYSDSSTDKKGNPTLDINSSGCHYVSSSVASETYTGHDAQMYINQFTQHSNPLKHIVTATSTTSAIEENSNE
eukprot:Lankesteria_metandrocarpae@DN8160_c0_g1_i1.p1